MGLILDSSVLIAAERRRIDLPAIFRAHPDDTFAIAAVTAAELLHGVVRADTETRRAGRSRFVEAVLEQFEVIEYDLAVARRQAEIWSELGKSRQLIGPYDLQIAATARTHNLPLATLNRSEFGRVAGLVLVDVPMAAG